MDDDFRSVITGRRSIRLFRPEPVDDATIERLVDLARWAPSGANRQPWAFVVVRDRDRKCSLCDAAKAAFLDLNRHVHEAPALIVACSDARVSKWHLFDTSAAVTCLLLAARHLGLGACWVGLFDERRVKGLLGIPERYQVVALVPLGYPAEEPSPPNRLEAREITCYEHWGERAPGAPGRFRLGRRGVPSVLGRVLRNALRVLLRRRS